MMTVIAREGGQEQESREGWHTTEKDNYILFVGVNGFLLLLLVRKYLYTLNT
jgi:hypothetical protein